MSFPQVGLLDNVIPSLPTVSKEVQEVRLAFTVTDRRGHFVPNLVPSDFSIHDNDEPPERITYFENQADLPLRLAVVIDSSDSVTYAFNYEKRAAAAFLGHILRPATDLALVIGFNQEARLAQGLISDKNRLSRAIRDLRNGGETALYDAVSAASQQLAQVKDTQASRRVIILITDGEDNRSHTTLEQAADLLQRNECAMYTFSINLAQDGNSDRPNRAMQELSGLTGGSFLHARDYEEMRSAFSKIDKELRSQYVINYKPANASPDGSFHHISIQGPKKLRIHHREGYFAR
jgi:VWFA-related protein